MLKQVFIRYCITVLVTLLITTGCSEVFTPYNRIEDVRLLAIRASSPWLSAGGKSTFDTLIFNASQKELSYAWSWCPFSLGASNDHACMFSEEELNTLIAQASPIALTLPAYNLGTQDTATFDYSLPQEAIQAMCSLLSDIELPSFVSLPDCSEGLDILIRLNLSYDNKTLSAVKSLTLLSNDTQESTTNSNPSIGDLRLAQEPDQSEASESTATELSSESIHRIGYDLTYRLFVDIDESASDAIVINTEADTNSEQLSLSWFITHGTTRVSKTFIRNFGEDTASARVNLWTVPELEDIEVAKTDGVEPSVIVVVRDGRGGVGWSRWDLSF
jgi:hypothetical protein